MFNVNGISFLISITLIIHSLISSITSQESTNRSNFTFDSEPLVIQGNYSHKVHYYNGFLDKVKDKLYLKIKLLPANIDTSAFIYISCFENEPTYTNSDYKSITPESFILIPQTYYQNQNQIIIAIEGKETLNYNLTVQGIDEVFFENGFVVDCLLSSSLTYTFKYNLTHETNNSIMFTALGPNIIEPSFQVFYGDKQFKPKQLFINGKGIMIRKADYTYSPSKVFTIKVNVTYDSLMQIRVKEVSTEEQQLTIRPTDQEVLIMDNKSIKQLCYHILALDKSHSANVNRQYIVNAKSHTQNAYYYIYDTVNKKVIKGVSIITSNYMLFDYNENYTLCINATEGSISEVSSTFQVMDIELLDEHQPYHETLIRGIAYEEYLPKGSVMYFRVSSIPLSSSHIEMNIHFIQGHPIMYKGHCMSYPHCHFTPDNITSLSNSGDISTAHVVNENIFLIQQLNTNTKHTYTSTQSTQPIAIVYCPNSTNTNCVFTISMRCDGDITNLLPETRMTRPILQNEKNIYAIEITNDNIRQVNVVLFSFSGNADLSVASDLTFKTEIGEYSANGNREIVTLMRPDGGSLLGKYYIQVSAMKNVYYSMFYYNVYDIGDNSFIVPPGEMFMETISKAMASKELYLTNRNIANKEPYYISITAINCKINVTFEQRMFVKEKRCQFLIKPTDPEYEYNVYRIKIDFVEFDSQSSSENEMCMFYIVGTESVYESELLLNEGTYHSMTFNNEINIFKYVYPFVYEKRKHAITFSLKKQTEMNFRLLYNFQGRQMKETLLSEMHRKIIIEITDLDELCFYGEPCPLLISIEPEYAITNPNTNINFYLEVLASEGVPSYLTLGEIRYSKLTHIPHYYYSDLAQGKQTEIVIDFLHGSGNAVAKLVKKDAPPEPNANWNKRIHLPDENFQNEDEVLLYFDIYDNKIKITTEMVAECENGCEVYIKVFPEEHSAEFEIDDYSIILKQYETIVELDVNEIVSNTIHNRVMLLPEMAYDYYKVTVHKDTDRVVFDVNCDLCVVVVNLNSEYLPSIDNAQWMFRNEKMFTIRESDPMLKGNKLKGQTFTIAITAIAVDGISGCYYDMKVLAPDRAVDIIHLITSSHEQRCDIEHDLGKCYLLFAIQANDNYKDVFIYVINDNINSTAVEVFAKVFDAKDFDAMSPEVKIQNFPSFICNDYASSSTTSPSLLHVPVTAKQIDRYLAVTVHSQKKSSLKVISAYRITPIVASFRAHSNELYVLRAGETVDIALQGCQQCFTEFVCLLGEIELSYSNDNETAVLNYERNPSIGYIVNTNSSSSNNNISMSSYYIKATYNQVLSLFYTHYTRIAHVGSFTQLNYGRVNYLEYHKQHPFPIEYYAIVKDEYSDITISFNFKQYIKTDTINGNEAFKLSGYVVSEEFIIARNSNKTIDPNYDLSCDTRYIESAHMGMFLFRKELFAQINSTMKYLYIHIEPEVNNVHHYTRIATSISLVPSGVSFITLPINEYHHVVIPIEMNMVVFKLVKQSIEHSVIDIELSCNSEWDFTVNVADKFIDEIDYNQNDDDIDLFFFNETEGKYFIQLETNNSHTLHFALFKNVSKEYEIVIKYRTAKYELEHFVLKTPNINIQTSNNIMNISVESVYHSSMFLINNAEYTLQIFNAEQFESKQDIEVLYPQYPPIFQYSNFTVTNRVVMFSNIPYDKRDFVYVNVLVTGRDGNTSEMLLYDTVLIGKVSDSTWWKIVLCVVLVVGVACVGGYFVYEYVYKKKKKEGDIDYEKDLNAEINVADI